MASAFKGWELDFEGTLNPYREVGSSYPILEDVKIINQSPIDFIKRGSLPWRLSKFKREKEVDWIDVPKFLGNFRKKGHEDEDLHNYSIKQHYCIPNNFSWINMHDPSILKLEEIYGDSNYQFLLIKNYDLLAFIGFRSQPDSIIINQIQGMRGKQDGLSLLKWPNALLNLTTQWAKSAGLNEVQVLPAERNKWEIVRDNLDRTKMIYNVTAKKEGFKYNPETKLYRKFLN